MPTNNNDELLKDGEIATRQHIEDVNHLLISAATELLERAKKHDQSKLGAEEHEKFSLAAARFKEPGNEFGTPGYDKTKEWLGSALQHHYANNSHHPEHYKDGILGMNLFDLLEMLIDWKAASARHGADGLMNLSVNQANHAISDDLMKIIRNTADHLGFQSK